MSGYVKTSSDQGGVHTNSGIPNHAFYLIAVELGGFSWERAGRIWYEALTKRLTSSSDFQAAADATFGTAGDLYGVGSDEQKAVSGGWSGVGIKVNASTAGKKPVR
jgi:Zn-dependent metalloprotease